MLSHECGRLFRDDFGTDCSVPLVVSENGFPPVLERKKIETRVYDALKVFQKEV